MICCSSGTGGISPAPFEFFPDNVKEVNGRHRTEFVSALLMTLETQKRSGETRRNKTHRALHDLTVNHIDGYTRVSPL